MAAEMQQGKDKILLFRRLKDQGDESAVKLVFQEGHTFDYSRSLDKVVTKDGTIIKVGELEAEVSIEAYQAVDDPTAKMLRDSVLKGEKLELWEVNTDEGAKNEEGKYEAVYCQGYLNSWSTPSDVEDEATISSTFEIELEPQFGYATLTEEQVETVQYDFKDTINEDAEPEEPEEITVTPGPDNAEVSMN